LPRNRPNIDNVGFGFHFRDVRSSCLRTDARAKAVLIRVMFNSENVQRDAMGLRYVCLPSVSVGCKAHDERCCYAKSPAHHVSRVVCAHIAVNSTDVQSQTRPVRPAQLRARRHRVHDCGELSETPRELCSKVVASRLEHIGHYGI
jgi:hypothetical protein